MKLMTISAPLIVALFLATAPATKAADPKSLEEALLNYTWEWVHAPKPPDLLTFHADGTATCERFSWHWRITGPRTAEAFDAIDRGKRMPSFKTKLQFDETYSILVGGGDNPPYPYQGRRLGAGGSPSGPPVTTSAPANGSATVYKPDQSPIEILKEQGPNISAWVSSTLDTPIPEAIWENVTFLKEALRDEAASPKPKASAATYGFALRLCAIILDDLAERKVVLTKAGGDGALHQGSQLTQNRRDHLTWPMYALERDERGERKQWAAQHARELTNWAIRTNAMRGDLGVWYDKFREGLRQGGK